MNRETPSTVIESTMLQALIDRIPEPIVWLSEQDEVLGINAQAEQRWAIKKEQLLGHKLSYSLSPSLEENILFCPGTIKVKRKKYSGMILKVQSFSTNNACDVISRMKKELAEAEDISRAKTEFIANISHDIRTPLTGVIGLSELLEHELSNEDHKEKAHMLHDSGEELLHMLNEVLDDVRAGNVRDTDVKIESFDLHQCIQDLIRLETPAMSLKQLILKAEITPDVPRYIRSDRNKIHRILLNLLGNAIKFTESGSIIISIECLNQNDTSVHLKFGISDTGIGILEEVQAEIFNRFFKVNSSSNGMNTGHGLGLHIAQSYVTLLGGHITLTSKIGEGSTFYFDLECPLGEAPLNSKERHTFSQELLPENLNLLLVEDSLIALKTLEIMLSKKGYSIVSATTGEDAWTLLQNQAVDLIITDIGLPDMSGTQLVQRIRNQEQALNKPPIPIIGLTGHAKETAWEECQRAGMNDVLSKPIHIDLVEQSIQKIFFASLNQEKHVKEKPGKSTQLTEFYRLK